MKKIKALIFILVSLIVILPITTSAESIINNNGIEISEEEYNNFIKIHTHAYIMTMNEEKYEKLKSLDYSNVQNEATYVLSTYNPHLLLTTEEEITKEEYDQFPEDGGIAPLLDDGSAYSETSAKELTIALMGDTTWNYVVVTATWKGIPKTRSFDVIGIRGTGFTVRNGSQSGDQIYAVDGNFKYVNYSWNGTNIKRFDNGFGISMNIVNDNINYLQLTVCGDFKDTLTQPTIFGSYQHAVKSLTLEESQNYTLGGSGLGSVFVYPYSISQKYDGMTGIRLQY